MTGRRLWADVADAWLPPKPVLAAEWIPAHIEVPPDFETPGRFDVSKFPHVLGVLEAVDDPAVQEIYLDWATRNAKTFTALSCLVFLVSEMRRPGMLASSTEARANDVIQTELYPILEACPKTAPRLLPERRRNMDLGVVIGSSRIRKGYALGRSSLAGFPAAYGLANEAGLWPLNSIERFRQRAKLYPFRRKLIFEGKPEDEGHCTISALVESPGTQRRYRHVQCPHCGEFQRLAWGDRHPESPGVKWDSGHQGRTDPVVARRTAWYRCVSGCRITDADRGAMMRSGRWVPEGQQINRDGVISGDAVVSDPQNVAFTGLSTLYSLAISGWGQLVTEYLNAQGSVETLREFWTGTLGLKWRPPRANIEPDVVAERMKSDSPIGICPDWCLFLTRTVDAQTQPTGIEFPWQVQAWGLGARGAVVDYGVVAGWEALRSLLQSQRFPHADGGPELMPSWTGIDSGDDTTDVYQFCRRPDLRRVIPLKGMSMNSPEAFRLTPLADAPQHSRDTLRDRLLRGEVMLFGINSSASQIWLQKQIEGSTTRDDPTWFSLPLEAAMDEAFLAELLNEQSELRIDARGFRNRVWIRKDANRPNDQRDLARYGWALAQFVTNNGQNWNSLPRRSARTQAAPAAQRRRNKDHQLLAGGGRQWPGRR